MGREREIYTINIVLLGNFNPSIITPYWLANKGIIREIEAESANIEIIHPNISKFDISDWLSIETTQDRMEFKTNRESHFTILRDLVVSIFSFLAETPIKAFGINHLCHFSLRDKKEYENLGFWLAPVSIFQDILAKPRLNSIQFTDIESDNLDEGKITLTISPSDLIHDSKSVVFNINHHFMNKLNNTEMMLELLVRQWDYSFQLVNKLNNLVWEKAQL